jgi:3-methyladenine DNA glycosylase AlkD
MDIIKKAKQEIKKVDKPENKIDIQRFFKEKVRVRYVLKGAVFNKISDACFKEVQSLSKREILNICDKFLESDFYYGKGFAFSWARKLENHYSKSDFARFERWLKKYVDNWGSCDSLCCGAMGILIYKFPELSIRRKRWIKSRSRWLKRASAVSLIASVTNGLLLDDVFETADELLMSDDDMVQKGYGWMLKDASIRYPEEVFAFVMKNKDKMPRTALRYAIERYPKEKRKTAMAK